MPVNDDKMTETNAELLAEIKALLIQAQTKIMQLDGPEPSKSNSIFKLKEAAMWATDAAKKD